MRYSGCGVVRMSGTVPVRVPTRVAEGVISHQSLYKHREENSVAHPYIKHARKHLSGR